MKNWFDLAVPHEDIRKGGFDEAVFAADLGDVVEGRAALDYNDPYTFFKKTYLTHGLTRLLEQVHEKLTRGVGPGVVELQTPFGGGKTHALVTAYHYLVNGKDVEELLPAGVEVLETPAISVVVGTQLNPAEGIRTDGVTRRTLWGDVAYQIGGVEAYRQVERADQDQVSPGKAVLRELLEVYQPVVLLFDEVLEYIVRARGVKVGDTTLAAQTLSFFNELTEVVATADRALMVVTLPSSELEDFGEAEQRNLAQLGKIFGRVESITTPVEGEEIYSIIRRRLFEPIEDSAAVRKIADAYFQKYQQHKEELPGTVREAEYRRKMEMAYPFHPDVINILYEKWGTFGTFQRTRGVLRLLANVVEDLYQRERNLDVILLGDINLNRSEIRQELIKHIGQEYEGIIAADIVGPDAKSQVMDRDNRDWKHLAERTSTSVFLHSFTADKPHAGVSLPYIKVAVMRPDTIPSLVTEILKNQEGELWYLNSRGDEYYFSNVPNLNRMVLDKKEAVSEPQVRDELEKRVRRELGSRFRCFLWPESSDALPDNRELKLAVLDPETDAIDLDAWVERRGDGFRAYKNTVFFAVPDEARYLRVIDAVREYLALGEIGVEIGTDERPGMQDKRTEVQQRLKDLDQDFPERIRNLYRTVAVPRGAGEIERIDLGQPIIGKEKLDTWYWRELQEPSHQKILEAAPSAGMLEAKFLNGATVSLETLLEQFYKDPTLPVPADSSVIAQAIAQAVSEGALGIGSGSAEEIRPESVRFGERLTSMSIEFRDDVFLLPAEMAKSLQEETSEEEGADFVSAPKPEPSEVAEGGEGVFGGFEPGRAEKRLQRVAFKASGIPASKVADLHRGVLLPLVREFGDFRFAIEIEVESAEGILERVFEQQVKETLRQIGAEFQDETNGGE